MTVMSQKQYALPRGKFIKNTGDGGVAIFDISLIITYVRLKVIN